MPTKTTKRCGSARDQTVSFSKPMDTDSVYGDCYSGKDENTITHRKNSDDRDSYLTNPCKKRRYNKRLFSIVAAKYAFVTHILSWGRDARWKKHLISGLPEISHGVLLDVACGTGDITYGLARRFSSSKIFGIDLTREMLQRVRKMPDKVSTQFALQDMATLGFRNESVDIITGGYALRNAPDLTSTLIEFKRVLKKDATAAFLDFSKPENRLLQKMHYIILKLWGNFWGALLHRKPEIYGYIAESLKYFPDRKTLRTIFNDCGFTVLSSRRYFFGMAELLVVGKR